MFALGSPLKNKLALTNPKAKIKNCKEVIHTLGANFKNNMIKKKTHNVCISLTYLKVLLTMGESLLE